MTNFQFSLNALIAACRAVALCRRAFVLIRPLPPFFAPFALCVLALIFPVRIPSASLENAFKGRLEGGQKVSGWTQGQSRSVKPSQTSAGKR
jgi:hypothetical protein